MSIAPVARRAAQDEISAVRMTIHRILSAPRDPYTLTAEEWTALEDAREKLQNALIWIMPARETREDAYYTDAELATLEHDLQHTETLPYSEVMDLIHALQHERARHR
jgi:hypothetical protein